MWNTIIAVVLVIAVVVYAVVGIKRNAKQAEEAKRIGAEFLIKNQTVEGVVVTDSGLQYKVLQAGSGERHPAATDTVKVHYHGTLVDGTVFDSSVERGQPISFGLHQVIRGWTEGLQTMVEGQKTRLFIPPELGYGDRSAGKIPPGSVLIFDVELLAIE